MDDGQNMQVTNAKSTILWVDIARGIGAFLVVLAHVDGWAVAPRYGVSFYYTLSRIGVPFFFLISGYLLLSREEDTWTFFRKRATRILIPFLVWSVIYDVINSGSFVDTGVTLDAVAKLFIRILRGPRASHLWFFYSLIGLYLLVPILRVFVAHAKKAELFYYIALWFIAAPILYIVAGLTPIKNGFEIYYTGGYVGYFLLGYYLGSLEYAPKTMYLGLGLFVLGFVFSFAVFYFSLSPKNNELVFASYPSLNIILMSLGAFILVKLIGAKAPPALARISSWLNKASLGIFLIHPLILDWMLSSWHTLGFNPHSGSSVFVIPLVAPIAFLLSWGCTVIISKIPVLSSIV